MFLWRTSLTFSAFKYLRWSAIDFVTSFVISKEIFLILFCKKWSHSFSFLYRCLEISNREFLARVEYSSTGQVLTHGRSHLCLCRGRRWTRKRTDGAGDRQEWLAVGGWPVRPYHRTPSAPVPPSPASPSALCGRLCPVPDAHPDRQKQINFRSMFTCT